MCRKGTGQMENYLKMPLAGISGQVFEVWKALKHKWNSSKALVTGGKKTKTSSLNLGPAMKDLKLLT